MAMGKEGVTRVEIAIGTPVRRTNGWPVTVGHGSVPPYTFDGYDEKSGHEDWPQCFVVDANGKRFNVYIGSITDTPESA